MREETRVTLKALFIEKMTPNIPVLNCSWVIGGAGFRLPNNHDNMRRSNLDFELTIRQQEGGSQFLSA